VAVAKLMQQDTGRLVGALVLARAYIASTTNLVVAHNAIPLAVAYISPWYAIGVGAFDIVALWTLERVTIDQMGHIAAADLVAIFVKLEQTTLRYIDGIARLAAEQIARKGVNGGQVVCRIKDDL